MSLCRCIPSCFVYQTSRSLFDFNLYLNWFVAFAFCGDSKVHMNSYVSMSRPSFRSCFWQMAVCNCFKYSTTTCWIVGKRASNNRWLQCVGYTMEMFCSLSCNQGRGEHFSYCLCLFMCVCVCIVRDSQCKALKDWLGQSEVN